MLHPQPQRVWSPRPSLVDMRSSSSLSVASVGSNRSDVSRGTTVRPLLRPESAMSVQSARSAQSGRTDLSVAQAEIGRVVRAEGRSTPSLHRYPTVRSDVWVPPLLEAVRTPSGVDYPPPAAIVLAPPTVDIPETEHGWRKWTGLLLPVVSACVAISLVVGLGWAISAKIRHPNA